MEEIVVGTESCAIYDVWAVLCNSYILKEKWSDCAGFLRIPYEDIEKLRQDLLLDKINRNDILKKILLLWVADHGKNAKLAELIRVCEDELGDNSMGEKLRFANNLPWKNFHDNLKSWEAISSTFQENVEQNISKFCSQIPNGSEYCSLHDVWMILSKSDFIKDKWQDVAGFLRIPIEDIERLRHGLLLDKIEPNYVLVQVLILWVGYQARNAQLVELIRVVEECGDNAVGEKLRLAYNFPCKNFQINSTTWATLSPAFQEKVEETVANYFTNIPIDTVKVNLEGDILLDLMTGKKPKLFNSTCLTSPKFYLERTLLPRHTISKQVFDEDAPDIFIFNNMKELELRKFVKKQPKSTSSKQLDSSKIDVRFIVLDQDNHFQEICKRVADPVHLLSYNRNSEELNWMQTRGQISLLQRFVEEGQKQMTEKKFLESLQDKNASPILISDSPGMGKSFLLANLALKLQKVPEKVVILTSVNEFIKQFKINSAHDRTIIDSVKVTLQNIICNSELGILEFPAVLSASVIKIELMMDGFDEVNINDATQALDIIKIISTSFMSIRLWITTRPHYLEVLEAKFNVLGYKIRGFDEEDQIEFLIKHWQHSDTAQRTNLDHNKVEDYANKVLQSMKSKLNKDDNDIAGIPLQLFLIGEVFEKECVGFASGKSKLKSLPTIRINSISDLYTNMTANRFEKFLKSHVNVEFAGLNNLLCVHVDLSIKLLFPEYNPKLKFIQVSEDDLFKIGIIQASGPSTDFTHRTFAEYFVAGYVVEQLLEKENIESGEFTSFFIKEILVRKKFYLQILPEMDEIISYKFLQNVIGYFVNINISPDNTLPFQARFSTREVEPEARKEIYHACANDSLLQIFKLFLNNDIPDETVVVVAIRNSTCEYFKSIISCLGESIASFDEQHLSTFLRVAVQRSELEIVDFLLNTEVFEFQELIENLNDSTKLLLHDCVSNTKLKPDSDIEKRLGVIQLLFDINPDLLEGKDLYGRTPILCEYVHVDLLKELIRLGANISQQDMLGNTVLHLSMDLSRRLNHDEYYSLIASIPTARLTKALKVAANDKETPIMRLLWFIDPSEEMLKILFKKETDSIENLFRGAITFGRNSQTLRNLIKFEVDVNFKGEEGESFLHMAAAYGNLDALKILMQDYKFDANIEDNSTFTPMDYAILNKVEDRFETAKALYNFGGRTSELIRFKQEDVLNKAIKDGNSETVRIIQEILNFGSEHSVESGGFKVIQSGRAFAMSPLHLAVRRGDELAVKELVENGTDLENIDWLGNTPLHAAIDCADHTIRLRIIKFLINNGANASAKNGDNFTFVSLLILVALITPDEFHEVVEYLAGKGLAKEVLSTPGGLYGYIPLHTACERLDLEEKTITLLNEKGISFNQLNDDGHNALICAIIGGRSNAFIDLLVNKAGVDWKHQDNYENSSVHFAAQYGHLHALKLLLDLGLDVNQINLFGSSPLHLLAQFGQKNILETAKILVDGRANVSKRDSGGNTALELFMQRRDDQFDREIRAEFAKILGIGDAPDISVESDGQDKTLFLHKAVTDTRSPDDCVNVIKSLIPTATEECIYAKDQNGDTFLHKYLYLKRPLPSTFHRISKYLLDLGHKNLFETPGATLDATVLHLAMAHFELKLETLKLFEQHGINFNRLDSEGDSLLAYAITGKRSAEFLSLLVNEVGVRWRVVNNLKQNLIHVAALHGSVEALQFCMNLRLGINSKDINGDTPLICCLRSTEKVLEKLQVLIDKEAEVNAKNNRGLTPLHSTAFIKEQLNILPAVMFLIESGAKVNAVDNDGYTFVYLLTLLINGRCPITPKIFQELAQYLIERDYYQLLHTPGGETASTPAQNAIRNLELDEKTPNRILYSSKSDINYVDKNCCSSLFYAVYGRRSRKLCQALIDLGADINQKAINGKSLLHISAGVGNQEHVELFVELGLDVNGRDNCERTSLHMATYREDDDISIEIIKCLIKNGADPNAVESLGKSPLYFAITQSKQSLLVINYLIDNGAKVDYLNVHKTSYIHLAAEVGGVEVLKLFLGMNILDVNAVDEDGDTPLHCAVAQTESDYVLEKVEILLECGANAIIKNKNGESVLEIAEGRSDWDKEIKNKLRELLFKS